jgi:hypothetical protein
MATIQTVFTAPSASMADLEAAIEKRPLALGPFGQNDEARLRDFLARQLRQLRSLGQKHDHSLRLYLEPTELGWLAKSIERLRMDGLNHNNFDGLILNSGSYQGDMSNLWAEASAFLGPKFLRYAKSSSIYCEDFLREVKRNDWDGLYVGIEGNEEFDYYNQTLALLHIAREVLRLKIPIWVSYFSTESLRCNTVLLGSQGFYIDTPEP